MQWAPTKGSSLVLADSSIKQLDPEDLDEIEKIGY